MTKDEAMKQAMDAITQYLAESPDPSEEAVENLCDARAVLGKTLAQPAQKRPQNCGTGYCSCIECVMEPAQQEPVAVVQALPMGHGQTDMHYAECQSLPVGTLLYTSPPAQQEPSQFGSPKMQALILAKLAQRKPLTDDEIYGMYNEPRSDAEMVEFARAIEAAHGIKENT